MGAKQPEWAGRLRQGELMGFNDSGLRLYFPPLFETQRQFLNQEEVRVGMETVLEAEMEWPIRLVLEGGKNKQEEELSVDQEEAFMKHGRDKSAIAVQKIFGVKIRHVLNGDKQPAYHLGQHHIYGKHLRD